MKKYKIEYQSMTAYYGMGYVYAENKEDAERQARAKAPAFSSGEKPLIKATETKD